MKVTTSALKVHQNAVKISNTTSSERSVLIQERSLKKTSITNAINKPTTRATTAASEIAATPNQIASNEIDLNAPQSISYVADRKFTMVPKTAKTHTSPDLTNDKPVDKPITKSS